MRVGRSAPPLFGRRNELTGLMASLRRGVRLITITGLAGMGKSSVLRGLSDQLLDAQGLATPAVWWVSAASAHDETSFLRAVADAIDASAVGNASLAASVQRRLLRVAEGVLLLDNLEQLQPVVRRHVRAWLRDVPGLCIVATSRVALGVPEELEWKLAGLAVPRADDRMTLLQTPSWQLFLRAWHHAHPAPRLDDETVRAAVQLVRHVDGWPMALELAAMHGRRHGLKGLVASTMRSALSPLHQVLDQNAHLVPPHQQPSFAALAVGYVPLPLAAMLALCEASAIDVLVDADFMRNERGCFVIAPAVREWAEVRARETGAWDAVRRAYVAYWARAVGGGDMPATLVAQHRQLALRFAHELNDPQAARLALLLDDTLRAQGQHHERLAMFGLVLTNAPLALRPLIQLAQGEALREVGRHDQARKTWRDVQGMLADVWRSRNKRQSEQRTYALACGRIAELDEIAGELELAVRALQEAIAFSLTADVPPSDHDVDGADLTPNSRLVAAELHARLAHALRRCARFSEAQVECHRAMIYLDEARAEPHDALRLLVSYELGVLAMFLGDLAEATQRFEAIVHGNVAQSRLAGAAAKAVLGILRQAHGQLDAALILYADAADQFEQMGHVHRLGSVRYSLASAYLERGDAAHAIAVAESALALVKEVSARRYETLLLALLAVAHLALGHDAIAREFAMRAADLDPHNEPNVTAAVTVAVALATRSLSESARTAIEADLREVPGDDAALFARLLRPATSEKHASKLLRWTDDGEYWIGDAYSDLRARTPLRRIVQRMIVAHRDGTGGVSQAMLIEAGWPDERVPYAQLANRFHVALTTLRRIGWRDAIVTRDGTYALAVELRLAPP